MGSLEGRARAAYTVRPAAVHVAKEWFNKNYPHYTWRAKFRAFTCGPGRLPEQVRLDLVEELAVKEGVDRVQARQGMFELIPFAEKVWDEVRDDRKTWIVIAEKMRVSIGSHVFRADKRAILSIVFTFTGILGESCTVERIFARLQLIESKHRAGRLGTCEMTTTGSSSVVM